MKYYLIKIAADYADEFNVYGMKVLSEKEFEILNNAFSEYLKREEKRKERIRNKETSNYFSPWDDEYSFYFGTNEDLRFDDIEDIRNTYTIKEISEEQYNTLKELNLLSYGETSLVDIFFDGRMEEEMEYLEEKWGIDKEE